MRFKEFIIESKESREAMKRMHLDYIGYGHYKDNQGKVYIWNSLTKQMKLSDSKWEGEYKTNLEGESEWKNPSKLAYKIMKKVDQLSYKENSHYKLNPIPQVKKNSEEIINKIKNAIKEKNWIFKLIPLDKIVSHQDWVDGNKLIKMTSSFQEQPKEDLDYPSVISWNDGQYKIIDGNHRVVFLKLLGQKTIKVRFLNI